MVIIILVHEINLHGTKFKIYIHCNNIGGVLTKIN